ncbi:hypothetical protein [Cytobacillus firmus]|uniref:hypothetical protein n=1 Tax=Cytobacillus firmus TaxID=1399 RepID=UPI001A7E7E64|nr:hypothetical protein [Cytobacillus firmus]MBG9587254.1 hypothetical protein [Cytobacillus firmus]
MQLLRKLFLRLEGVTLSIEGVTDNLVVTSKDKSSSSSVKVADGGVQDEFKASFQAGANQGQSLTISVKDMRSNALNITGLLLKKHNQRLKVLNSLQRLTLWMEQTI